MFGNNPFNLRGGATQQTVLNEDPAHYARIAKQNAAQQAKRDAADPEAAKKRKDAQAAIAKKKPVRPADIGRHSSQGGGFIGRRNESKYVIPEEIPANERTAFHGAAAAAAKAGKKSFNFGIY